jgi:peptidoglycan/LPS O-acetylase OafA/YrhL
MAAPIGQVDMNLSQRNVALDWLRSISALLVCAGHTRYALFPDFGGLASQGLWPSLFYFITGYGHAAVVVFFVLSGYLVGGSVLANHAGFQWPRYLINRYVRLWVVLVPALAWTYVLDQQTLAVSPELMQRHLAPFWSQTPELGAYSSGLDLLRNLMFQQTVFGPVYGSNGPLWSLANEAWYYLLFPLVARPLLSRSWRQALTHWPLAALMLACMPSEMLLLLPVWVAGALLRVWPAGWLLGRRWWAWLWATVFALALLAFRKQAAFGLPPMFGIGSLGCRFAFGWLAWFRTTGHANPAIGACWPSGFLIFPIPCTWFTCPWRSSRQHCLCEPTS